MRLYIFMKLIYMTHFSFFDAKQITGLLAVLNLTCYWWHFLVSHCPWHIWSCNVVLALRHNLFIKHLLLFRFCWLIRSKVDENYVRNLDKFTRWTGRTNVWFFMIFGHQIVIIYVWRYRLWFYLQNWLGYSFWQI